MWSKSSTTVVTFCSGCDVCCWQMASTDAAVAPPLLVPVHRPSPLTPGLLQVCSWLAPDCVNICLCPQRSGWLHQPPTASGCWFHPIRLHPKSKLDKKKAVWQQRATTFVLFKPERATLSFKSLQGICRGVNVTRFYFPQIIQEKCRWGFLSLFEKKKRCSRHDWQGILAALAD